MVLKLGPGSTAVGTLGPRSLWPHGLSRPMLSQSFSLHSEGGSPSAKVSSRAGAQRLEDTLPRHVGHALYLCSYKKKKLEECHSLSLEKYKI